MKIKIGKYFKTALVSAIGLLGLSAWSEDFRFIHMTDSHVYDSTNLAGGSGDANATRFGQAITQINAMTTLPAFIVLTGDSVDYGGGVVGTGNLGSEKNWAKLKGKLYKYNNRLYARYSGGVYSIPVYITPGNHDYRGTAWAAYASDPQVFDAQIAALMPQTDPGGRLTAAQARYGKRNFAVTPNANTLCVFLDSGSDAGLSYQHPQGTGLTNGQMDWLFGTNGGAGVLKLSYANKLLFMHHPGANASGTTCDVNIPFGAVTASDASITNNRDTFLSKLASCNVKVVFSGHEHQQVTCNSSGTVIDRNAAGVRYVQTGASFQGPYRIATVTGSTVDVGARKMFTYNNCGIVKAFSNGGFESGSAGWTTQKIGASDLTTINLAAADGSKSGLYYAKITNNISKGVGTERAAFVRQTFTVPWNATRLTYWVKYSWMYGGRVGVKLNGTELEGYGDFNCGTVCSSDWSLKSFDISGLRTKDVTLEIFCDDQRGQYSGGSDHAIMIGIDDIKFQY